MSRMAGFVVAALLAGSPGAQEVREVQSSARAQEPAQRPIRLSFGVYSFKKPTLVYKQFRPAVLELSERMSKHLDRRVVIDLQVEKTYEECLKEFVAGDIDFVRFGPASYVLARRLNPGIQLLATEREDAEGAGLIVVRKDSAIRTIGDLRGQRFAFGDDQSTIGRFLSQAELVKAGIHAADLAGYEYLERHDIVYKSVEIGDFAAGALHRGTFEDQRERARRAGAPELRVLHSFDNVSKPWIARAGLDIALVTALRQAILAIERPDTLEALKAPGFRHVEDREYDRIREGMKLSEQFLPQAEVSPRPGKKP